MTKLLKLITDLKADYIKKIGTLSYKYDSDKSCVEKWAEELGDKKYLDILSNINIRQKDHLVIFKYMKFEILFSKLEDVSYSKFWDIYDGIYRECRGTVIDVYNDKIALRPFDKFFGINEREETSESVLREKIKTARMVQFADKLDGSIVAARWYEDHVVVASSGMLEGTQIINNAEEILKQSNYTKLLKTMPNCTFMFESIMPNDMHIVEYAPSMFGLHLIGARGVGSGMLFPYSSLISLSKEYKIPSMQYYEDIQFDEILNTRKDYKAHEKEGYVMYIDSMLVKIKCDDYILLHKMWISKCSMNGLVQAVYNDKIDDIMQDAEGNYRKILENGLETIAEYERLMDAAVKKYEEQAPKERVEFFKWAKTIPKYLSKYITNNYIGRPISYLTHRVDKNQIQYLKFSEIEERIKLLKAES